MRHGLIIMDITKEYSDLKSGYDDFLQEVTRTVVKLIKRNKIPIAFDIYGRTKTLVSIEEKLLSKRFNIKKSICEFDDMVGLRIVLLFPEFKNQVIDLLCNEFDLLNDPNKKQKNPDKFGYSSTHLILRVKSEWLSTPDWESHSGKKIEVQIRTVAEHIWAETSHTLFYKREENIPVDNTRDLYRLAALLEVVDEKLDSIKTQVEKHFKHISECPYNEILNMDLNSETFRRVMLKNSDGIYDLNDTRNKELSSRVEHDYDIFKINILEDLINEKISTTGLTSNDFVSHVITLLELDKQGKISLQSQKSNQ